MSVTKGVMISKEDYNPGCNCPDCALYRMQVLHQEPHDSDKARYEQMKAIYALPYKLQELIQRNRDG